VLTVDLVTVSVVGTGELGAFVTASFCSVELVSIEEGKIDVNSDDFNSVGVVYKASELFPDKFPAPPHPKLIIEEAITPDNAPLRKAKA
jgi:hypothetical protein